MPEILKNICTVDIVFFTALLVATIIGTVRGASGGIARQLSLLCGAAAVWLVHRLLTVYYEVGQMLSFAGATVVAIFIVMITYRVARRVLRLILGQPSDAIFGGLLSLAGAFIILAVLWCGISIFIPQRIYDGEFAGSYAQKLVHPLVVKIHEKQAGN